MNNFLRNNFWILAKFSIFLVLFNACTPQIKNHNNELIIFHAGSLSVPMRQIIKAFNKENLEISILTEAAGSRDCARKITDLKKDCDIMASADYTVIDQLLIPEYASWNIRFASNEMVIAFKDEKDFSIDSINWTELLLQENIRFGRSEPNADPCGYRTILVARLSEKYYKLPGFANKFLAKDRRFIRPKETDLLALIETNTIDYVFIYRSIAEQHGLKYIQLPEAINLKSNNYANQYASASVELSGKTPGSIIVKKGEPMVYGITIPTNAPNKKMAIKFLDFFLSSKGMKIMKNNGQPSLVPCFSNSFENIPEALKKYASHQLY